MDTIRRQVDRARTRLIAEQFLARLVWAMFVALSLAVVAIAVPKLVVIERLPQAWDLWCLGSAVAAGLLAAIGMTWFRSAAVLDAAIEIDRRFGLNERLASSLQLTDAEKESEAGQALLHDAERRAGRVEVTDQFRVRVAKNAWLPLVPAIVAFAAITFMEDRTAESKAVLAAKQEEAKRTKNSVEKLNKKLKSKQKEAEEKGLKNAADLLQQLEKNTRDLTKKKDAEQKSMTVKLSDLAEKIESRRKALGDKESFKQQLQNLKKLSKGPADKMATAIKEGDFKAAMEEVKKLREDLKSGKLSEQAKKELAKQLAEMKQKMQQAAENHQQAMQNMQQQIENLRKQGKAQQAANLQQKLDQMAQQAPQMQQLQQMAMQLGKMQQAMEKGETEQAAQMMQQLSQQLEQMQQQADEMQMLNEALEQISDAKQSMGCQQCQGMGCESCMGGFGDNFADLPPGFGMGKGRGKGPRPDDPNATSFRDSQVRDNPRKGRAVITGEGNGPNVKGRVQEQIKDAMAAGTRAEADPLAGQRLPRTQREHAEEYFNALRGE